MVKLLLAKITAIRYHLARIVGYINQYFNIYDVHVIIDILLWNIHTCVWTDNVKIQLRSGEEHTASLQWNAEPKRKCVV